MSGELILPPSGNDMVDSLRSLQIVADTIDTPNDKIAHVRRAIRALAAGSLLGKQMMVDGVTVYAANPDAQPDERVIYRNMLFIGRLNVFSYLLDDDIPVDSLTLNFDTPAVVGASQDDSSYFERLTMQVPVLAIDSCVLAEVA